MRQYNILLVDDEANVLSSLGRALRREYGVFSAANGMEALTVMEKNNIDLVIADYHMPGMTGVELLEKTLEKYPNTIRIFLTASVNQQLLRDAINIVNAHGYITKPWDNEEVKALIKKWEIAEEKRKQAEKRLKESQKYSRDLIRSSLDMIIAVDGDRKIIEFNKAAQDTFGYSYDEILGNGIEVLYSEPQEGIKINEDIRELGGFTGKVINRRKNGETFPSFLSASILRDTEDEFIGVMGISRDITRSEQMKEELLKVQSLNAVGTLAGGIAHDFNNILTGILGNISLARLYTDAEKISERLVEADKSCVQARDLIQRLLTFSNGGAPIRRTTTIAGLLYDSINFALSGSGVGCEFFVSDDLWPVEVDVVQINQVLNNIIINADQAMPDGGMIMVRADNMMVRAEHALPLAPGPYIKVSIEDQGVGIPKEHLQKIFDLFYTTKDTCRGLGLATCYSIVKKHNGHIGVESRVEVGTTFHVYLPASPEKTLVQKESIMEKPITGTGRILVMDDEKHIRDLVVEMLSGIGYEVITSIDGGEAVALYKEAKDSGQPYDVVITDLTIPGGMGGRKTIQKLLELDKEVKAIVSSGYSGDPIMANFKKHGFKGVIAKPYEINQLSKVLHEVMTGTGES